MPTRRNPLEFPHSPPSEAQADIDDASLGAFWDAAADHTDDHLTARRLRSHFAKRGLVIVDAAHLAKLTLRAGLVDSVRAEIAKARSTPTIGVEIAVALAAALEEIHHPGAARTAGVDIHAFLEATLARVTTDNKEARAPVAMTLARMTGA